MKKKVKIFFISIVIISLLPVVLYFIIGLSAFLFPDKPYHVTKNYRGLSTEELIKKTRAYNILWRDEAMEVLATRKEDKAVWRFIELLNSPIKSVRQIAMFSLGEIGDERAIEPLMKIVKEEQVDITYKKHDNPDSIEALKALAMLKYEGAYSYAVWLAGLNDDPNDFRSYGITMLEYFEKPESISILEKIAKEDPKEYIREKAINAIEHIKEINRDRHLFILTLQ